MNYLILSVLLAFQVFSGAFKADVAKSTMTITGTSTVHDWTSVVKGFSITGTWNTTSVTGLKGIADVKSIESGKSIMDKKTYDALKSDQHPQIILTADHLTISGKRVTGTATLNIAGVAKKVNIAADIVSDATAGVKVKGKMELKMTNFGIDPPTAMFGSLKTGDDITVHYEFLLTN